MNRWGKVSKATNIILIVIYVITCVIFILPFALAVIVSFSSEESIITNGYTFFPSELTTEAYKIIFSSTDVWKAFSNSIIITIVGTILSLFLILTMAYALSCREFRFKKLYYAIVVIPMFFSGGLAASYVVNTQFLHLKDTLAVLILPSACSSYFIFIAKRYFTETIPREIIDAAKIDGASNFNIFAKILLPLSGPLIATLGTFEAFLHWNTWYNAMIYIGNEREDLFPLQYLLIKIQNSIETSLMLEENVSGTVGTNPPSDSLRMALVVIIVLPIILIFPFVQKLFKDGITHGALKE